MPTKIETLIKRFPDNPDASWVKIEADAFVRASKTTREFTLDNLVRRFPSDRTNIVVEAENGVVHLLRFQIQHTLSGDNIAARHLLLAPNENPLLSPRFLFTRIGPTMPSVSQSDVHAQKIAHSAYGLALGCLLALDDAGPVTTEMTVNNAFQ